MKFCLNTIKAVLIQVFRAGIMSCTHCLIEMKNGYCVEEKYVNNPLRYIIPMNPEQGLIMISYTDDKYTD